MRTRRKSTPISISLLFSKPYSINILDYILATGYDLLVKTKPITERHVMQEWSSCNFSFDIEQVEHDYIIRQINTMNITNKD